MKVLISGASSTLGHYVMKQLEQMDAEIVVWDKDWQDIHDEAYVDGIIKRLKPDVMIHMASAPIGSEEKTAHRINVDWTLHLAKSCNRHHVDLVFTSSYAVIDDKTMGPFNVASPMNADSGIGLHKRWNEETIRYYCPKARIIRLGRLIDSRRHGNHLLREIKQQLQHNKRIAVRTDYYPALVYAEDAARALLHSLRYPPGTYLVDSNRQWNYRDILKALSHKQNLNWQVVGYRQEFRDDRRMIDTRLSVPALNERLTTLP